MLSSYKALLISASEFHEDPQNLFPLQGPVNDAPLLRDALTDPELGLFDLADVRLLPERSKRDIMTAAEAFFRTAERDDQLLLYYSGHGMPDIDGNLYLCARDTVTSSLIATGISDSEINAIINLSAARAVIVILDCCYSGAFKGALPAALKGEGRFVITSSRRGQLAADAELVTGASPFTGYLVEGLRLGTLDANGDGYVALNDLYDYVLQQLRPSGQIPQRHFDHAVGDVHLARARQSGMLTPDPAPATGRPLLSISTEEINLDDIEPDEALPAEIIDVVNRGGGELDWTVTTEADWIELEPQAGFFRLTMRPRPGVNRANVLVRDRGRGGSRTLRVSVRVRSQSTAPKLALSEQVVDFGTLSHRTRSPLRTIQLQNQGGGRLNPAVEVTDPRIRLHRFGDILELRVDTTVIGQLNGEVLVRSEGGEARIPVRALIEPGPILTIEPQVVDFGRVVLDERAERLVRVVNAGSGELEWTHGSSGAFFTVQRVAGGLRIRHHGRPPGRYHGSVWVRSNGGELTFDVQVEVVGHGPQDQPSERTPAHAPQGRARRRQRGLVIAAMLLVVATVGVLGAWVTRPRATEAGIPTLDALVADFQPLGFTPPERPEHLDLSSLPNSKSFDDTKQRLLREAGLRRALILKFTHPKGGRRLELRILEVRGSTEALEMQQKFSLCRPFEDKETFQTFEAPGVAGSEGTQCVDQDGRHLQEVSFTREGRLFKLKLWGSAPFKSKRLIQDLARAEAAVAR
jgi:Caspase domain